MSDRVEPAEVGLRYLSLGYRLRRVVDDGMTAGGLSLARTKVLRALHHRGVLRQSSLAEELGQAPRSVTQSVEALEREGLIERTTAPDDRRSKLVTLTPEGSKALAAGTAAGEHILHEIFGALGGEQLADLDKLLDAIDAGMSAAAPADLESSPG
ncbi:MarR family winged helix-turn-helix transcriptional regulator [Streptosporangium subroseum]|uniref:MarR family winged helix-turn-helix transcriptional regulator n=1 Tax=Streptosporangium subroseum TaxID=106412 RepID=UPI003087334E|nr:MarR family winged helix-turn-helix transcriptional regulator [Streptosporangium subroseum]